MTLEVDGGMKEYLHSLKGKKYDPLTRKEEEKLLKKYKKTHDKNIRDKLIMSNMRYASSMVNPYVGRGLSYMELLSEAHDGLIESIDRYDSKFGTKLISYSKWWIMQRMNAAIDKRMNEKKTNVAFNVNVKDKEDEEEEYIDGTDFIVDNEDETAQDKENKKNDRSEYVKMLMEVLDEREIEIIRLYFGIDKDKAYTLTEIGEMFSMTKERIRQIVERAMSKIRSEAVLSDFEYEN